MSDDSPPDNCSCDWGMSNRRTTRFGTETLAGKLVIVNTDPDCPVHGNNNS